MRVLGVNWIGLLFFIGWASIATLLLYYMAHNIVSTMGWSSPFSNGLSDCFNGVCIEDKSNNPSGPMPMSSEGMSNDPILEPKHKIFLSHSGAQKEFVEHLCKALEDRFHYPFFDRRHESLPKGERFPELIVQAAKQCEMLIVVVSDEYFMSKWPMIELSTFVKTHKLYHETKSSFKGPKILPLFYGLSVDDLKNATMQRKWFQNWETLAKIDPKKQIIVSDWKDAFKELRSFNGLSYDKYLKEIVAYEEKIVSHVSKSILPDIRWDDSHVQGKSNTLKVIGKKIEEVGVSRPDNVKVVGLYGVGGIGKTTTCKTLYNELSSMFEGRVCHIELPSDPSSDSKEFFQKVLQDLTRKSVDDIQHLNEGECKDSLRKSLCKQKTFLAIDNVWNNHKSIQLAKTLLELPYHLDSLVVVTARSQSVLESLGLDGDACLEMPDLEEADAVRLFLYHVAHGKEFFESQEKQDILTCVRRCYFSKGDGEGHHYHPLALEALGLQLGYHGKSPSEWVKNLPHVRTFNSLFGGNPVFDILRNGFDRLSQRDQTLFMDVGHFAHLNDHSLYSVFEWLCVAHKQDIEKILRQLESLKRIGLLFDMDLRSGRISMHDLYLEFINLEVKGSLNESLEMLERKWVLVDNCDLTELKSKPWGGFWPKMTRLSIKQCNCLSKKHGQIICGVGNLEFPKWDYFSDLEALQYGMLDWRHLGLDLAREKDGQVIGGIESLEGIKWDYFSQLEVLQLRGLFCRHQALNFEGLTFLRILELTNVKEVYKIEGLERLNQLTYFMWTSNRVGFGFSHGMNPHIVGQLPSSLERLKIIGDDIALGSDLLAQCDHLSKLELHHVEARLLDFSNCSSLESVSLSEIRFLQTLSRLAAHRSSNLQSLHLRSCRDLVDIPGIEHLIGLKRLHIDNCLNFEVPNLLTLTKLEHLFIKKRWSLVLRAEDSIPHQLRELYLTLSEKCEPLNLNGFNQLEVLSLSGSVGLTSLAKLGDLPALRRLDLHDCRQLLQLPDLSKSKNLEELDLYGCFALKLHEKDIQMLSELPLLQKVRFPENVCFSKQDQVETFIEGRC